MMHVGAQGNKPYSLAFFRDQGLDINEADASKSTPLHWALVNLSGLAINYLLAWDADINLQDRNGFAALHLAVMTAPKIEDTSYIKRFI
jgi:ankyrin repeat protein